MEALLDSIKQVAAAADEAMRSQLIASLNQLTVSLETPDDTLLRYGGMSMERAAIRIGYDLGLFKLLAQTKGSVALEEAAQKTGAEPELLHRVLRYMAAMNAVDEVSAKCYAANNITKNLTEPVVEAGLGHFLYTVGPQHEALPAFLSRTSYKSPVDSANTAFQDAWKTRLHAFPWFADNPDHLAHFNKYMALRRQPERSWLSVYPVAQQVEDWAPHAGAGDSSSVLLVDMGGGVGHECRRFKDMYPNVPGRVVLQDLPHSIAEALRTPGVENMVHDFFQPQPIKDAKFYFLRGILHDHPPRQVRAILEHIKAAMGPSSVLLIDEMTLPEAGVNANAAFIDMTMLTALAGMERTEGQWRELLEDVGLVLGATFMYAPRSYMGVLHVTL